MLYSLRSSLLLHVDSRPVRRGGTRLPQYLTCPILLHFISLAFFIKGRFIPHRRTVFTPLPQLLPIQVEADGNRDEQDSDAAEERARILDAHPDEHLTRKKRKAGGGYRA
jgi:hypothetical protein